jgi:hypothetical protein
MGNGPVTAHRLVKVILLVAIALGLFALSRVYLTPGMRSGAITEEGVPWLVDFLEFVLCPLLLAIALAVFVMPDRRGEPGGQ